MKIILSIVLGALIVVSAVFAFTTESEWQGLTDEALDHYYHGRNKEAVGTARKALRSAEELFDSDDLKMVGSIDDLATYLAATGNTEEADQLYQRALSILEKSLPSDDHYLAIFMDYLALFYDKNGKNEYANELRARAKAIRLKKSANSGR